MKKQTIRVKKGVKVPVKLFERYIVVFTEK
jgi:hypothetical protein